MYKVIILWIGGLGIGVLSAQDKTEEGWNNPQVDLGSYEGGSYLSIVLSGINAESGFGFLHEAPAGLENNWFPSRNHQINVQPTHRLGNSKWHVSYGVGIGWHRFELRERHILEKRTDGTEVGTVAGFAGIPEAEIEDLRSNYFGSTYIDLPLELSYYSSGEGHERTGLLVRLGAYLGVVISNRVGARYKQEGLRVKLRRRGNDDFQTFRYGVQGTIGYSGLALFYRYNLSPFFKDGRGPAKSENMRYSMLGLRLGLFTRGRKG